MTKGNELIKGNKKLSRGKDRKQLVVSQRFNMGNRAVIKIQASQMPTFNGLMRKTISKVLANLLTKQYSHGKIMMG